MAFYSLMLFITATMLAAAFNILLLSCQFFRASSWNAMFSIGRGTKICARFLCSIQMTSEMESKWQLPKYSWEFLKNANARERQWSFDFLQERTSPSSINLYLHAVCERWIPPLIPNVHTRLKYTALFQVAVQVWVTIITRRAEWRGPRTSF